MQGHRAPLSGNIRELIGNTPLLRIPSLSELTGCEILLKCENLNPGGSVKDRAAKGMVEEALASGALKPGMTIIEGTAGNTGIGLALVGRSHGIPARIVMPNNQAKQKIDLLRLYGAEVTLTEPCPFTDERHFFHTTRRLAEAEPHRYWWANQFENLANFRAHYTGTGPEILAQTQGRLDWLVSAAGSGGTIAGNSRFLKERLPGLRVALCDPQGSGLCSFLSTGTFATEGTSFSEGVGIMRKVANFVEARIDEWFTLPDAHALAVASHLRDHDGIVLGTSAALNVAACLRIALREGPGRRLVTFWCDQGDRSAAKLYNPEFLATQGLKESDWPLSRLIDLYRSAAQAPGSGSG